MDRWLRTEDQWHRWLEVLSGCPGHEQETSYRAAVLVERHRAAGLPEDVAVERALEDVARIVGELAVQEGRDALVLVGPSGGRAWWIAGVALALAAGVAVGVLVPSRHEGVAPQVTLRGDAETDAGVVRVERAGRNVATVVVGRGVRPRIPREGGPLAVRWEAATRARAADAYVVIDDGIIGLDGAPGRPTAVDAAGVSFTPPPGASTLVVVVHAPTEDASELGARVGAARIDVEPLGSAQIVAFDLTGDAR